MSDYFKGKTLVQAMFQPISSLGKNAWSTKRTIKHFGMFIFFSFLFLLTFTLAFDNCFLTTPLMSLTFTKLIFLVEIESVFTKTCKITKVVDAL